MQDTDRKALYDLVGNVYAFYRQDCSPFALGVWWEACKPYDLAAVHDAMNRHCVNPDNGQFLPKPADIAKLIGGGSADSALQAWAKFERAVMRVGPYQTVVFDDPLIHRVVADMGGWTAFATTTDEEWPFTRNHFVNLYRGYRSRGVPVEYPRCLPGIAETHNSAGGFSVDRPVLLGDPQAAQLAYTSGSDRPLLTVTKMPAASEAIALPAA